MHVEHIKFTDYNGVERKESHYFNLSKGELVDMEATTPGGYGAYVQSIIDTQDGPKLWKIFRELIMKSYGVKSPDGRRFIKNQEVLNDFIETEAFSELIIKFVSDAAAASAFVNGIIPSDLAKQLETVQKSQTPITVAPAE